MPHPDRPPRRARDDRPADRNTRAPARSFEPRRDEPRRDEPRRAEPRRDEVHEDRRGPAPARPDDRNTRAPVRSFEPRRDEPRRDEPRRDEPRRDEPRAELKICGVNACHAVAERRPDDVRRVYITAAHLADFGAFLKKCAAARIAYHVVEDAELEKITQSVHHEGVCFIVRERPASTLRQLLATPGPRCLVYLDGVQNPHNLGAIVRVCAHFGATGVLAAGAEAVASTAMLRTAEGGGEWVEVLSVHTGPEPLLAARAAGFKLIATGSRAEHDLYSRPLPARAVLLLGSETHGLAPGLQRLADETVRIPGTGRLDSLNVACACAVLLSEYWRAHTKK